MGSDPKVSATARIASALLAGVLLAAACAGDDEAVTTAPTTDAPTTVTTTPNADPTVAGTVPTTGTRPPPPTTPPGDVEVSIGGTVVIGTADEPLTLNPLAPGGEGTAWSRVGQLHLVGISDVAPDLSLVPELLIELPSVDNGGIVLEDDGTMTVTMEIHPDAVWDDGVPISGEDLFFTYQTLLALEERGRLVEGADPDLYRQILPDTISVGPKTFVFRMEHPTLQHELLFPVVLPRHALAGTDVTAEGDGPPWPSGGPFLVESWLPGSSLVFVRNPSYWKTDEEGRRLPYLDRVEFRFYDTGAALVDAFRIREVDVITPPPIVQALDALVPLGAEGAGVFAVPGTFWEHIEFQFGENNRNGNSLNAYREYRQAVAHAIDVEALVTSLYAGYADPISSYLDVIAASMSSGAWSQYPYDVEEARRLLDEACRKASRQCEFVAPVAIFTTTADGDLRVRLAALLEPMLEAVGISVELQLEPSSLFFGETLLAGTWDVGAWAYHGLPGSAALVRAHDVLDPAGPPPFGSNYARWGTDEVAGEDPLVGEDGEPIDVNQGPSSVVDLAAEQYASLRREMDTALDRDELERLVGEAEQLLADQAVIVPLFARLWLGAVWLDEVGGYQPNPTDAGDTWTIEQWFRADGPGLPTVLETTTTEATATSEESTTTRP